VRPAILAGRTIVADQVGSALGGSSPIAPKTVL
jgi:hypothetical protein